MDNEHDLRVRLAAFPWLAAQVEMRGEVLPRTILARSCRQVPGARRRQGLVGIGSRIGRRSPQLAAAVFALALVAGCIGGPPPADGLIRIANLGRVTGSIRWDSPENYAGRAGTEQIDPCREYARAFSRGTSTITISTPTDRLDLTWTVPLPPSVDPSAPPPSGVVEPVTRWFVIDATGQVAEVGEAAFPPSPFCPPEAS